MRTCGNCNEQNPDRARYCLTCGAPLGRERSEAPEIRKTVTIVFCDLVDSTPLSEGLDPEALRHVISRYHDEARNALERHGGTVEKFIGDAVVAVFGIPVVHEDDPLRAIRACVEMREAIAALNEELERTRGVRIGVRTGVNTGEVVAGNPSSGQAFATGDPVVVAQRLEGAAGVGEILIGETTAGLVAGSVAAEPIGPLELKGKAQPVPAWRVVDIEGGSPAIPRRLDAPLVGRERELKRLLGIFEEVIATRSCRVVTVLGEPGIGKTRLARELATAAIDTALVVEGRCLPYGRGITYWPLVEIVRGLAGLAPVEPPERVRWAIAELLPDEPDSLLVSERVAAALGLGESGPRGEEIHWGVRKLFEALARERPLLVLLDDIQWAEETFLDLIEYLAGWSRAPMLLCCLARPDLLDVRPSWGAGGDFEAITLQPLGAGDVPALVGDILGSADVDPTTIARIVRTTGGNPLFVEEMVRMLIDKGLMFREPGRPALAHQPETLGVPGSVQSVLAARLDQLTPGERAALQRASVIGEVFWWGAVAELTPPAERPEVRAHLHALVRKDLIKPDRQTFLGEDAFAFGHILIRDAAYESMPKGLRAELHERFADWADARAEGGPGEYDEIIGYHLEQTYRYGQELGPVYERQTKIAERGAARLRAAGGRADQRGDDPAAVVLLERAAALLPRGHAERLEALLGVGVALTSIGESRKAIEAFEEILESNPAPRLEAFAFMELTLSRVLAGDRGVQDLRESATRSVKAFERLGDEAGLARAWYLVGMDLWIRCRYREMSVVLERAIGHARQSGNEDGERRSLVRLAAGLLLGPEHAVVAANRCREIVDRIGENRLLGAQAEAMLAGLEGMQGSFDRGWELYERSKATLTDLGSAVVLGGLPLYAWSLLRSDPLLAERELRLGYETLAGLGERAVLSTVAASLAGSLCDQGRYREAEKLTEASELAASREDVVSQIRWRCARARAIARQRDVEPALELARTAVGLSHSTDSPSLQAEALSAVAEINLRVRRKRAAREHAGEALALCEGKGDRIGVEQARELLARSELD